jgi:thiol:disulfide interchange protein DsbC
MLKRFLLTLMLAAVVALAVAGAANAFQGPGCAGECADCHSLSMEDAAKLLKTEQFKAKINDIRPSPVKGLWEVEITQNNKTFIVYMDFSKKYLVEGQFTPIGDLGKPEPLRKVDVKGIPLDGAVVMGDPSAEKKVIIFDDPDCPYCKKLHEEVKAVLGKRKDVAFYIKLYPLAIHPEAYEKSRSIACAKSVKLLEDAFAGKKLPKASCKSKEVDENIKLAEGLGIRGTPAIIFPDGRLLASYVQADVLMGLIDNPE